jgi:hypothetical protein
MVWLQLQPATTLPPPPRQLHPFPHHYYTPAMCLFTATLPSRQAAKPPLAPTYDGPFVVLECSPHTFRLQIGDKLDVVATSWLKAEHLPPTAVPAWPRRLGRPQARLPITPAVQPSGPPASVPVLRHTKLVSFATAAASADCQPASQFPPSVQKLGGRCSDEYNECRLCKYLIVFMG